MNKEEQAFQDAGKAVKGAALSQMFGKPCLKLKGKAFACLFDSCMVFKLGGDSHHDALELSGSRLFDPSGKKRPMKEWVQVSYRHRDKWAALAKKAAAYINA
ncbi:MAG: hypothetical protein AB1458_05320 [Bacteroidota bacterium]